MLFILLRRLIFSDIAVQDNELKNVEPDFPRGLVKEGQYHISSSNAGDVISRKNNIKDNWFQINDAMADNAKTVTFDSSNEDDLEPHGLGELYQNQEADPEVAAMMIGDFL